jgi:hypothetical protein
MRILLALSLSSLLMMGCGDDDNGGGGSGGDAGTGATGATGGMGATGGGGLSVEVSWQPLLPCANFTPSDYEVTVAVQGEVAPVTVEGSVTDCTGPVDMLGVNTIECPNTGSYIGTVTVTDAVGSDEVQFTINVCMDGSAP